MTELNEPEKLEKISIQFVNMYSQSFFFTAIGYPDAKKSHILPYECRIPYTKNINDW